MPAVKATPLSLIVNEIVGDAVRRGLSDGGGDIHVEVRRTNGHFHIRIEDTSEQIEVDPEAAELGQMLLEASAHQLGARIDRKTENGRTTVEVTLLVDGQEHAH